MVRQDDRQEEDTMFSTTDCDLRYAAHTERVARIDRAGGNPTVAVQTRPRLTWVGALIARANRLPRPIRRVSQIATAPVSNGLS